MVISESGHVDIALARGEPQHWHSVSFPSTWFNRRRETEGLLWV